MGPAVFLHHLGVLNFPLGLNHGEKGGPKDLKEKRKQKKIE